MIYLPKRDFSISPALNVPRSGAIRLIDIISGNIPIDEKMCSSAEILGACESHHVMRLETAKAGASERFGIAIAALFVAILTAAFLTIPDWVASAIAVAGILVFIFQWWSKRRDDHTRIGEKGRSALR